MTGKTKFALAFSATLVFTGVALLLSPYLELVMNRQRNREQLDAFESMMIQPDVHGAAAEYELPDESEVVAGPSIDTWYNALDDATELSEDSETNDSIRKPTYKRLLEDCVAFNKALYENGQESEIRDMTSVQSMDFDLSDYGIDNQIFGYITIEKINIQIPIYICASNQNLKSGAGRLTCTSIPVGGINTNSVLAAHSGYVNNPMFTKLDTLRAGDQITITNIWGTMTYEVKYKLTIIPTDISAITIQEGRDLVTLMTCTPVHVNSHRLLVVCERSI